MNVLYIRNIKVEVFEEIQVYIIFNYILYILYKSLHFFLLFFRLR